MGKLNVPGPTLLLIWDKFIEDGHSHSDQLDADELCERWSYALERQRVKGKILGTDSTTMVRCVDHISPYICDASGRSSMDQWLYSLLFCCAGSAARTALSTLARLLEAHLCSSDQAHHDFCQSLEDSCFGRSGRRPFKELLEKCLSRGAEDMFSAASPTGPDGEPLSPSATRRGLLRANVQTLIKNVLTALGLVGDELITYPQTLALCFGRFECCVELHMYDLTNGRAKSFTTVEGIWHTGVVAFGKEYFYNGRPTVATPGKSGFGEAAKVVHLGYTFQKQHDFHNYVAKTLRDKYTMELYDLMENNCNHFSDQLVCYLLNKHLPDDILHQDKILLQLPGFRLLWPAVRRVATMFTARNDGTAIPEPEPSAAQLPSPRKLERKLLGAKVDQPGSGDHNSLARELTENDELCRQLELIEEQIAKVPYEKLFGNLKLGTLPETVDRYVKLHGGTAQRGSQGDCDSDPASDGVCMSPARRLEIHSI